MAAIYCNFTYSLLGIETQIWFVAAPSETKLQFHLLPIRDWNHEGNYEIAQEIFIAISLTPY